jgi:hypothetical protein
MAAIDIDDDGGNAKVPACVMQNGQCSRCSNGDDDCASVACSYVACSYVACSYVACSYVTGAPTTLLEIHFVPLAEQISIMPDSPTGADKACEMEGASALMKIAKHAIQICSRFLVNNFPMQTL